MFYFIVEEERCEDDASLFNGVGLCVDQRVICGNQFFLFYTVERGQKVGEQIVIGTPGTVLDWCSKLKFIDPKKIKVFVLDEADVMIATQGHQDQSIRIQR